MIKARIGIREIRQGQSKSMLNCWRNPHVHLSFSFPPECPAVDLLDLPSPREAQSFSLADGRLILCHIHRYGRFRLEV
ncbi:MAG: hypothetical protein ACREU3_03945 [Steroidobacteraceae bacterium]